MGAAVSTLLVEQQEVAVVLAGRNQDRVQRLAKATGIESRSGQAADAAHLLDGVVGVINTAGPFRDTAAPLIHACVRAGVHYVDVSNEADTHLEAWAVSDRARETGAGVVPGAGLGTLFGERLIDALTGAVDGPVSATLVSVPSGGATKSPGVTDSQNTIVLSRPLTLVEGRFQTVRQRVRQLPVGMGPGAALIVGTGDVVALSRSSGLQMIEVAAGVDMSPVLLRWGLPLVRANARRQLSRRVQHEQRTPELERMADAPRQRLVAEVLGSDGVRVWGRLSSRSGTAVAARAAVAAMRALTHGGVAGTHTAFQILGDHAFGDGFDPEIEITAPSRRGSARNLRREIVDGDRAEHE